MKPDLPLDRCDDALGIIRLPPEISALHLRGVAYDPAAVGFFDDLERRGVTYDGFVEFCLDWPDERQLQAEFERTHRDRLVAIWDSLQLEGQPQFLTRPIERRSPISLEWPRDIDAELTA